MPVFYFPRFLLGLKNVFACNPSPENRNSLSLVRRESRKGKAAEQRIALHKKGNIRFMPKRLTKGRLIALEGIDGAGKTTQCARLEEWLRAQGWLVERLREPTDGPYGRRIRELARQGRDEITPEEELGLFLKDREENVRRSILPALERGAVVLLDRYYYSTIAYQGAIGLDPAWIRRENEKFAPPADLLIYLRIPAELARPRIVSQRGGERDLFEREDYLKRVQGLFDTMTDPQLVRIDASQDPERVFEQILAAVRPLLIPA